MEDLKLHVKLTINAIKRSIEFEESLNYPSYTRFIFQLQGVHLIICAMESMEKEAKTIKTLYEKLQVKEEKVNNDKFTIK